MSLELQKSLDLLPQLTQGGRLAHPVVKIARDNPDVLRKEAFNDYDPKTGTLIFKREFSYGKNPSYPQGMESFRVSVASISDNPSKFAFLERVFGRRNNGTERRLLIQDALVNQISPEIQANLPLLRQTLLNLGIAEIDYWDYVNDGKVSEMSEKWLPWAVIRPGDKYAVTAHKEGFSRRERGWDKEYSWRVIRDDLQRKLLDPSYDLPEKPQRISANSKTREIFVSGLMVDDIPVVRMEQEEKNIDVLYERARAFYPSAPYYDFFHHEVVRFDSVVREENGNPSNNHEPLEFFSKNRALPISVPIWKCSEADITELKIEELVHPHDLCAHCMSELSQRAIIEGTGNYEVKSIRNVNQRVSYDYKFVTEPEFLLVAEDASRDRVVQELREL